MNVSENGICSICDEVFKDSELTESDNLFLCTKDLKTYKDNQWVAIKTTTVSDSNMNDALILQDMKDDLKIKNCPSYIFSSYQESDKGEISTISTIYTCKKIGR